HRKRIARETLDIYAPIANRLGLNALYLELQDLSFKQLHPMRYRILASAIKAARGNRREVMNRLIESIRQGLEKTGIEATVTGREKTIYPVYNNMRQKWCPRSLQGSPLPRGYLLLHAQGQDHGSAGRRDRRRLRLCGPHRHRTP